MTKIFLWLKDYPAFWVSLSLFGLILIALLAFPNSVLSKLFGFLDTASAIAIATLAFIGYYQYSKEKSKQKRQLENLLQQIKDTDSASNVALFIQFGGSGNMTNVMESAKTQHCPNAAVIEAIHFGDDNNRITKEDVIELKNYCANIRSELAKFDNIHVFYGGAIIGGIVIADILNNTSNIIYYHKNGSSYEPWYSDSKHGLKESKTLHNSH